MCYLNPVKQVYRQCRFLFFFHLLTNCTFILDLLNIDIPLFILLSCQNYLISHYLFYEVFNRKYLAKFKNYKVIMQIKKRNLWGRGNND